MSRISGKSSYNAAMLLDDKQLEDLDLSDLQKLVTDEVSEITRVDYKSSLQINTGDEKREFLNDVSSFANTKGGYLIFGVQETAGKPTVVTGIPIDDTDSEIRRLDNLIRDKIVPRIPGVHMKEIQVADKKYCIVIRVPQSWAKPHMVDMGSPKFFTRNSKGKYPLDYHEIRSVFDLSGDARQRIEQFQTKRLGDIFAGTTTPVRLGNGPKTILHLIPLSMSDPSVTFDVRTIAESFRDRENMFIRALDHSHERYNLEGYQDYVRIGNKEKGEEEETTGYVQVFRNGSIEAVEGWLLGPLVHMEGKKKIAIVSYEDHLLKSLPILLRKQKELGVDPPIFLMMSLSGLSEFVIEQANRSSRSPEYLPWYRKENYTIDHDPLVLPDVLIEDYATTPDTILRPILDALWNAGGYPECPHFDAEGKWKDPYSR